MLQTGPQDQTGIFQTLQGRKITNTVPSFSQKQSLTPQSIRLKWKPGTGSLKACPTSETGAPGHRDEVHELGDTAEEQKLRGIPEPSNRVFLDSFLVKLLELSKQIKGD